MTRSVLLVEDEAALAEVLASGLRDAGFVVTTAATGDEAAGLLRHYRPDVLITDITMPGTLGGFELALEARERDRKLPIICTTGYAGPEVTEVGRRFCDLLLQKPFPPSALVTAVETLLAG